MKSNICILFIMYFLIYIYLYIKFNINCIYGVCVRACVCLCVYRYISKTSQYGLSIAISLLRIKPTFEIVYFCLISYIFYNFYLLKIL